MRFKRLLLAITVLFNFLLVGFTQEPTLLDHGGGVRTVAFSPVDASLLASAGESNIIKLWDLQNDTVQTLSGHTAVVNSIAFSPNGELLASVSDDRTIRLWNVHNQQNIATFGEGTPFRGVSFSPDGELLATGGGQHVKLWDVRRRAEIATLWHEQWAGPVTFSYDGRLLAAGDGSNEGPGTVKVWDVESRQVVVNLDANPKDVTAVEFSLDNRYLASSGWNGHLKIWDVSNWELLRTIPATGDYDIALSPDGKRLASTTRGHVSLWNVENGVRIASLSELTGWIHPVDFAHDGTFFAIGSEDGFVRFYNIKDIEKNIEKNIEARLQALQQPEMVRLIYFLPSDRPARSDRITALRQLIKNTQEFFADQMEHHGFGRKTFSVETDEDGEPVVHRIDGKFPEAHYYEAGTGHKVWTEVRDHFEDRGLQHIHFVGIDLSSDDIHGGRSTGEAVISFYSQYRQEVVWREADLTEGEEAYGGFVVISASGDVSEEVSLAAHELGHALGLLHDFREARDSDYLMAYGSQNRLSKCSAEWLSVNHFFNTKPVSQNTPADIQLLSIRAYGNNTTGLRFKVTDPDGLHQAQLLMPELDPEGVSLPRTLFDCKQLNGEIGTFESAIRTADLIDRATLQVMDVNGHITWATLPIELDAAVSAQNILDVNNDGIVNTSDLTPVALHFGRREKNPADVNEDGVVNTIDLLLVAANLSSVSRQAAETFAAADVQKWLTNAKQLEIEDTILRKGIVFLEHLLNEMTLLSKSTQVVTDPLKAIFEGHTNFVSSVAFSPDGQMLASASWDGTIRLWDPHTAQLKTLLIGHTETVNGIVFSPDGQTLASASHDTTIRLWDPHTAQHKTTLRAHSGFSYVGFNSIAFSPDGQTLAAGGDYSNPVIRLWDIHNQQNIRTLTGHTDRITSIAFSPDGQILATGSADNTIKLWNPHNRKLKRTLIEHTQAVESIAFSADGQTLASGSRDRTIRLWNPHSGKLQKTLTGYTDWINPVAFSPDQQLLICGGYNSIRLWNTQTGQYKQSTLDEVGHILSVAFSVDGQMLASGSADKMVRLWDVQTLLEQSPDLELAPDKITGPWLWMIAPTEVGQGGANSINVDSLAIASGGSVTEVDVATNGAKEGDSVGDLVWTLGEISPTGGNNVHNMLNNIGLGRRNVDDHSSYALITLESATALSDVTMRAGSNDAIKIWLNGEVVHNNPIDRESDDFQDEFKVNLKAGDNLLFVKVSERAEDWSMFVGIDANVTYKVPMRGGVLIVADDTYPAWDVNQDGKTDTVDLLLVVADFEKTPIVNPRADVNGDGTVDKHDIIIVATHLGESTDAAAPVNVVLPVEFTPETVQRTLDLLRAHNDDSPAFQRAIANLAQLLATLIPQKTALLANYPNPFNPETWIPYQLVEPTDVTLCIHAVDGSLIRTLSLGYKPIGIYQTRGRAAYWDGKNELGESVANGVYFYTLSTKKFTSTRKMLILK